MRTEFAAFVTKGRGEQHHFSDRFALVTKRPIERKRFSFARGRAELVLPRRRWCRPGASRSHGRGDRRSVHLDLPRLRHLITPAPRSPGQALAAPPPTRLHAMGLSAPTQCTPQRSAAGFSPPALRGRLTPHRPDPRGRLGGRSGETHGGGVGVYSPIFGASGYRPVPHLREFIRHRGLSAQLLTGCFSSPASSPASSCWFPEFDPAVSWLSCAAPRVLADQPVVAAHRDEGHRSHRDETDLRLRIAFTVGDHLPGDHRCPAASPAAIRPCSRSLPSRRIVDEVNPPPSARNLPS